MNNKIGFNFLFAQLSFPIGLVLFRKFNFESKFLHLKKQRWVFFT